MYKEVNNTLKVSSKILNCSGVQSFIIDTRVLFGFTFKTITSKVPLINNRDINYTNLKRFYSYVERRSLKEPIAYIIELKEFYSIDFYVNRNVLIPRPETEHLIEYMVKLNQINRIKLVLEVGIGSGCIINTLNALLRNIIIEGIDVSVPALKIAFKNLLLNKNLNYKIVYFHFPLHEFNIKRKYDVIISNPPYIKTNDLISLLEDVILYEPKLALDGGSDGLYYYTLLAKTAKSHLDRNGEIVVEIGYDIKNEVIKLFEHFGFQLKKIISDLNGIDRILIFRNS